jgi:hypothetical protein
VWPVVQSVLVVEALHHGETGVGRCSRKWRMRKRMESCIGKALDLLRHEEADLGRLVVAM